MILMILIYTYSTIDSSISKSLHFQVILSLGTLQITFLRSEQFSNARFSISLTELGMVIDDILVRSNEFQPIFSNPSLRVILDRTWDGYWWYFGFWKCTNSNFLNILRYICIFATWN